MKHVKLAALSLVVALGTSACADDSQPTAPASPDAPAFARVGANAAPSHAIAPHEVTDVVPIIRAQMERANARLAAEGANIRVGIAELMLAPDAPAHMGTTVYANNREHHLRYFWVAGDERRLADGNNLTYLVDESEAYGYTRNSYPATEYLGGYFDESFAPWTALACGKMNLVRRPDTGADPSVVFDGTGQWWLADVVEAGWRALPAGVLGVTYTSWFVDDEGNPTDVDGDGRRDSAFAEIWYNLGYYWTVDETSGIDFLSVAIHENGHALGIGHFGKIFRTNANGKLHFANRAIMNAAYVSRMQELQGTDKASFCGNFSNWP